MKKRKLANNQHIVFQSQECDSGIFPLWFLLQGNLYNLENRP